MHNNNLFKEIMITETETQETTTGKQMLSESKFYMGYSRWIDDEQRYETWDDSVQRVMDMHRKKYADKMTEELHSLLNEAQAAYSNKLILGAQRALQFGGKQLLDHPTRMYNCASGYCDRPAYFQEAFYILLCGAGAGFSVQKQHINKLPSLTKRSSKKVKIFVVPDSIQGWADSVGVLLSSYFTEQGTFPEYKGCQVHFDFSKVRPKGSMISGGFKAPGPDGLRNALLKCEELLEEVVQHGEAKMRPIHAYDLTMYIADAVLSGGVRRSATICLFSKDDDEMLKAKTGDWFVTKPSRGRSNNSALIKRDELTRDEWANIMKSVKDYGEPGFIFTDNLEFTYNPLTKTSGL
jgi:ribonucleoside-triphosphate reductase (thioredoxin)